MAITKLEQTTVNPDGSTTVRRIEERTSRVTISTPLAGDGTTMFKVVVQREWVEYLNGTAVKITQLPPLDLPITASMVPFIQGVASRIDLVAKNATRDMTWPKLNGELIQPS